MLRAVPAVPHVAKTIGRLDVPQGSQKHLRSVISRYVDYRMKGNMMI